jgi:hypothetical protein
VACALVQVQTALFEYKPSPSHITATGAVISVVAPPLAQGEKEVPAEYTATKPSRWMLRSDVKVILMIDDGYVATAGIVAPENVAVAVPAQVDVLVHVNMETISLPASVFSMVNLIVMALAPVGAIIQLQFALAEYLPAPSDTIPANSVRVSPAPEHVVVLPTAADPEVMIAIKPSRTVAASDVKRTRIGAVVEAGAGSVAPDSVRTLVQPLEGAGVVAGGVGAGVAPAGVGGGVVGAGADVGGGVVGAGAGVGAGVGADVGGGVVGAAGHAISEASPVTTAA